MRSHSLWPFFSALFAISSLFADAPEEESPKKPEMLQEAPRQSAPQPALKPFTGKITRNKVRLRLQPNLDSPILREFSKGDLLIVMGESGDFYAIKAPEDMKGYVFRTFVLDNVVEGNNVNIRFEPDLEATVIGQLEKGALVNGAISPLNSKWLEISLPETAQFYVSKEYIENIGDAQMLGKLRQRLDEVTALLTQAQGTAQDELQKPFDQINLDPVYIRLNKVINQFTDFPEQVAKSKELLTQIQDAYLQKKITFLEARANGYQSTPSQEAPQPAPAPAPDPNVTPKMGAWIPVEAVLYEAWAMQHGKASMEDFYAQQRQEAVILTGVIEPYIRSVRNKPGDYVLVSKASRLPSA
ncbi:MAG: SH3 domain-containing protein, partial [Parachlamydia sp.]|nr:SH3 domain-containing protein [Parachlamydia sp.]